MKGGMFMRIKWFGQSAFLLTSQAGTRILIDPYGRLLRYRMPEVEADIVLVTHEHRDHNQIQVAVGDYLLVNEPKEYTYGDGEVLISGFKTFHDKVNGAKKGDNIVFRIQVDGLTICHCGDLGHLLSEEQSQAIGKVDVLMTPVGGRMTINGDEAAQLMRQLRATITIPMHYRTKALRPLGFLIFDKVDKFLAASGQQVRSYKELDITQDSLSQAAGVAIMQY